MTMPLPATCKRIIAKKLSSCFREATEEVVVSVPTSVGPTELLVKNRYVGVNASDINFTAGHYKPDVLPPFDCGFEALGEVAVVGEKATEFAVGDVVVTQKYGAFSEYQVIPARYAIKVPSLEKEWLPLYLSGLTASISIGEVLKPQKGEVAVVTAAGGGTGHFAVQLLKKVYDCSVIGVTSSSLKEDFLKELGCDHVIVEERESIGEGLKRLCHTGVNIAYESVGGETFDAVLDNLALHGRILSIGSISGYNDGSSWEHPRSAQRSLPMKLLSKSGTLHSFFLPHFVKYAGSHFATLCELRRSNTIKSFVDLFPEKGLASVPAAIDFMYARKNKGKVMVEL